MKTGTTTLENYLKYMLKLSIRIPHGTEISILDIRVLEMHTYVHQEPVKNVYIINSIICENPNWK